MSPAASSAGSAAKVAALQEEVEALKAEVKKLHEREKETQLLLNVYKSSSKDVREKRDIMVAEKKLQSEVERLTAEVQELSTSLAAFKSADSSSAALQQQISDLQAALVAKGAEEAALLHEIDVTGQAFEKMQDQNARLLSQMQDKEDTIFKIMSEKLTATQQHNLLAEEKRVLVEKISVLQQELEKKNLLVQKFGDAEKAYRESIQNLQKRLHDREAQGEIDRRVAQEKTQLHNDKQLRLQETVKEMEKLRTSVTERVEEVQKETHKAKRLQETINNLNRIVEKSKSAAAFGSADEVLEAELNELKSQIKCACCNTRKKDTVLKKCYHVFCEECITVRYESRQRKCPQCSLPFGLKDYHRIYLT